MSAHTPSGQQGLSTHPHTKGPFDLSMGAGGSGGLFVRDAKRRLIAGFQTTSLSDEMLPDEGEANAQLFIAAGDMLSALKALVGIEKCVWAGHETLLAKQAAMDEAERAISKAEKQP